ncbi:hypothetical protein GCK32_008726, partial [Trichostrongylus colubriformis]
RDDRGLPVHNLENHTLRDATKINGDLYRFLNFALLTLGACCFYCLFNGNFELMIKKMDVKGMICCLKKERRYMGFGLRPPKGRIVAEVEGHARSYSLYCCGGSDVKVHRSPHINFTGNACVYYPGGPDSDFEYDPYLQTCGRVSQLMQLGHCIDKLVISSVVSVEGPKIVVLILFVSNLCDGRNLHIIARRLCDYFIRNYHDAFSGHTSCSVKEIKVAQCALCASSLRSRRCERRCSPISVSSMIFFNFYDHRLLLSTICDSVSNMLNLLHLYLICYICLCNSLNGLLSLMRYGSMQMFMFKFTGFFVISVMRRSSRQNVDVQVDRILLCSLM